MSTKFISLILCLFISIFPSTTASFQTNDPDPEFLGDFMVYNFLDSQFNLKESDKYQKALSDIPDKFKGVTKIWTLIYLSWIFDYLISKKYGDPFADKMLETANKKWAKAGELSGENFEVFEYWFPKLENIAKKSIDKTFEGKEIPAEVYFAYAFLIGDSGSPFFQQANPEIKNSLEFLIAIALAEAKDASMTYMENVVEIGGPLESNSDNNNKHLNSINPKRPTSSQTTKSNSTDYSIDDAMDQVRNSPNDSNAHFNLGRAYLLSGQYRKAMTSFKDTIKINSDDALANFGIGTSYIMLGEYQESVPFFKKAIQINPNLAISHEELGRSYSALGKHQKAIKSLKEAIRLKPNSAEAYFSLGKAYNNNSQFLEGIFSLKEGLRLQPGLASAHMELGFSYSNLKRYDEAIISYKEVLRIRPRNSTAHNNLGVIYGKLGRKKESISEYREALRIDPENTLAHENLSKLEKKIVSERGLLEKKIKDLDSLKMPDNKKDDFPIIESFKVTGSKFFVSTRKTKDDEWDHKTSNFVPLVAENTCYSWVINLDTQLKSVQIKEVFIMPYIPNNSKFSARYTIEADGKSVTGRLKKEIKNNQISNSWCVAKGDPSGKYNFNVFIEEKFIKSFPFTVGEDAPTFSSQGETNKNSEKNTENEFQKYSEYSILAGKLYSQFMEILKNTSEIDKLSESFLGEKITSEYAINQKNILSAKTGLKMDSFNKNIIEFAPPSFSTGIFIGMTKQFNAYLRTLPKLAKKSVELSYKMFEAAITQNLDLYSEFDVRSRDTIVSILEGENNYLNLQKLNIKSNTPGYKYYSVIQNSNNVLINLNKARVSDFFADTPSSELDFLTGDSQAYLRIANIELEKGQDTINSSDLVINNWLDNQRKAFSKHPQYVIIFESLGKSLAKSFEVENNIVGILQVLIGEYPNVESLDKADILLGEFVEQRMNLQEERTRLLSKFQK